VRKGEARRELGASAARVLDDEGWCSTRLRRVDHSTSDLVDGETVGGGEEQVVVLRSSASSPVDRSRVVFPAAAAAVP
jgi:hypothetical protein